jgi:hypothetical protein
MRNFIFFTLRKIFLDKIKEDEIEGAFSTPMGEERNAYKILTTKPELGRSTRRWENT